jgi:hypothetical protein
LRVHASADRKVDGPIAHRLSDEESDVLIKSIGTHDVLGSVLDLSGMPARRFFDAVASLDLMELVLRAIMLARGRRSPSPRRSFVIEES